MLSLTHPQAPQALPWGLPLGQAGPAPLVLPTAPGGVWLQALPGAEAALAQAAEAAVLALLQALPWRHAQVQVFDFGIRKRFAALASLQVQGLYHLHAEPQAAQRALDELERQARHRHHHLLDEATPTLADYNHSAPQPEPYQLLLIHLADFPAEATTARRLAAVLREGAAAGFYVLAFGTQDEAAPALQACLAELYPQVQVGLAAQASAPPTLQLLGGPGTEALAAVLARHPSPLSLPPAPTQALLAELRERAFADEARWPEQDFLQVPVGTTLDGREQVFWRMGARSDCYNALMLGMPGSGKSTLLNNLIVGIAERYTASQIRLYLMDYKDGVEFQAFDSHPNVEKIFLDNEDMAAATDLLQSFSATIHERNERFKALRAQVRNLDDYNRLCPSAPLPRLLLVVDEAQRLLAGADARSDRFAKLLVDVTKRGRSAGVHILLATQSLQGVNDVRRLSAAISLRVSFMLNNGTDAEGVLDARNSDAPLKLRKFEFVLNAASGQPGANVLARGLPTPEVAARLAAVRAQRAAHECITPQVVGGTSGAASSPASAPSQAAPPPVSAAVTAPSAPAAEAPLVATMNSSPARETQGPAPQQEDILARMARLHNIRPQIAPVTATPSPAAPTPQPENPL